MAYSMPYADNFLKAAEKIGQIDAMNYVLDYWSKNDPKRKMRYLSIFEVSEHASKKRFHTFDGKLGTVFSEEASHGSGSEGDKNDGWATFFTNKPNSHATSLGMYLTGGTYTGKHGRSMYLDGLQSTNSNARSRAIVVHGASYVKAGKEAGDSWGCPALSNETVQEAIDKLKGGSFLYIYTRKKNEGAGDTIQVIKRGNSGKAVEEAQELLRIKKDGKFGPETEATVIAFQKKNGLVADGIIGPATWAALRHGVVVIPPKETNKLWYPKAVVSTTKMKTIGKYADKWPVGAIIHFTSGQCDTEKDAMGSRDWGIKQGYAFLTIGPTGVVYQNHPMDEWGYHAGTSSYPGLGSSVSKKLVGIEVSCAGKLDSNGVSWFGKKYPLSKCRVVKARDNMDAGTYLIYTKEQEKALEEVITWLYESKPSVFQIKYILGHDSVAKGRKNDPGGSLSMTIPEYQKMISSKVA